jgi:23S rRNA (guanosine2251-2'-O)-methyltransferase
LGIAENKRDYKNTLYAIRNHGCNYFLKGEIGKNMHNENSDNVVYGIHAVEELLKNRAQEIDRVYFESDRISSPLFNLLKLCRKERLASQQLPVHKLDVIAGTSKHQGVAAICSAKAYLSAEALDNLIANSPTPPVLLVPASIEDPRNLGSLIRSCVAFGVNALLFERKNTTLLGATVAKAAAGMLEHISVAKPKNLEGIINGLKMKGFMVVAAHQNGTVRPDEVDLSGPLIIVLGGEHRDIPPYLQKLCTHTVRIPMASAVASLNVSVAGALVLYERMRQRELKSKLSS